MDLTDIFEGGGVPTPPTDAALAEVIAESIRTSMRETAASGLPEPLLKQARAAAQAHDAVAAVRLAYESERQRLNDEMDKRLAPLRDQYTRVQENLAEAVTELHAAMDAEKVTKIPMPDRDDIVVKIFPGRKTPITKKWLIGTYGPEEAKKIWDAVPKKPDTCGVVIPNRHQDEPDLG